MEMQVLRGFHSDIPAKPIYGKLWASVGVILRDLSKQKGVGLSVARRVGGACLTTCG